MTLTYRVERGEVNGKLVNAVVSWNDEDGEEGVEIVTTERALDSFCGELERLGYTETE